MTDIEQAIRDNKIDLDDPALLAAVKEINFSYWCENSDIKVDGDPFSFVGREYLIGIYQDEAQKVAILKASQLGLSIFALLRSIYRCKYTYRHGVLYLMPTKDDISDFSQARMGRIIEDNEVIKSMITNTDKVNLKRIGEAFLYFRGTRSETPLRSIPVDGLVLDERDLMDDHQVDIAKKRLGESKHKAELELSTPSLPDYGIDATYNSSDRKRYLLKCQKCNAYTCLETEFPNSIGQTAGKGYFRKCMKCDNEIFSYNGVWAAEIQGRNISGYHISRLHSPNVSLDVLMEEYQSTKDMTVFMNHELGMAYVEAENRMTVQEVYECCGNDPMLISNSQFRCAMGVDQGKGLHVVIGYRTGEKSGKLLHFNEYKDFEDLPVLVKKFNVKKLVIDGLPETRKAREVIDDIGGDTGYLNFSTFRQKIRPAWNPATKIVNTNKSEIMDTGTQKIQKKMVELPRRSKEVEVFAKHCHNVARRLVEETRKDPHTGQKVPTGSKMYEYVRVGTMEDHYRRAFDYFCMALEEMPIDSSQRRYREAVTMTGKHKRGGYG